MTMKSFKIKNLLLNVIIIYSTRSELASLALSLYVCLSGMDDIIIMHCTCTVLYQGP